MSKCDDDFAVNDSECDANSWSDGNRKRLLKPIQDHFATMQADELAEWSAVTISPASPIEMPETLEPGRVEITKRALETQLEHPAINRLRSFFVLEFVLLQGRLQFTSDSSDASGEWWKIQAHGFANFPPDSPQADLFKAALHTFYSTKPSIEITKLTDVAAEFHRLRKNQYTPSGHAILYRDAQRIYNRRRPLSNSRLADFRGYIHGNNIAPTDFILVRRMTWSCEAVTLIGNGIDGRQRLKTNVNTVESQGKRPRVYQ